MISRIEADRPGGSLLTNFLRRLRGLPDDGVWAAVHVSDCTTRDAVSVNDLDDDGLRYYLHSLELRMNTASATPVRLFFYEAQGIEGVVVATSAVSAAEFAHADTGSDRVRMRSLSLTAIGR